ncbi:MAG: hypothetical protein HY299_16045 [Verrucomicrobia bacterium]|nr:hypothetical protein [Verrucomicrobiota bacterium]
MKTLLPIRGRTGIIALLLLAAAGCGKQGSGPPAAGNPPGASPALTGYWVGTLDAGPSSLKLGFDLIPTEPNKYRVSFDSFDQGVKDLQGSAAQEGAKFTLDLDLKVGGLAKYSADISADGKSLTGTWRQGPATLALEMTRGDRSQAIAEADPIRRLAPDEVALNKAAGEKLQGEWKGSLDVKGLKLRVLFNVGRRPEGGCVTEMTSVDQGNTKLAVSKTLLKDKEVKMDLPGIQGAFVGNLEGADKISGQWTQAGMTIPLLLERSKK